VDLVGVGGGPFGEGGGQAAGFDAQRSESILDADEDGGVEGADDEAVAFENAKSA